MTAQANTNANDTAAERQLVQPPFPAAAIAEPLNPTRVRQDLSEIWERNIGNNILFSEAARTSPAHPADPRFRLFMDLVTLSGNKALQLQEVLDRWGQEHQLDGAPRVNLSRGFIAATLANYQPFGYPELLRLHRQLRQSAESLRRKLEQTHGSAQACTTEERNALLELSEWEVTCCDQALSRMKSLDADAFHGESTLDPDWYALPANEYPQPGMNYPPGPHYSE